MTDDDLTIRLSREQADLLLEAAEWDYLNGTVVLKRLRPEMADSVTARRWRERSNVLGEAVDRLRAQVATAAAPEKETT